MEAIARRALDAAVRRCRWHECRLPLTARQARFCSRACTVRQQNRDRARAARTTA